MFLRPSLLFTNDLVSYYITYIYPCTSLGKSSMEDDLQQKATPNNRVRWFSKKIPNLFGQKYIFMSDWIMKENIKIRPEKWFFTLAQILDLQWNFFLNKILQCLMKKYLIFNSKLDVFETKVFEWLNCNDLYQLNIV